jgi:DNA-binding response OmpR family regulator
MNRPKILVADDIKQNVKLLRVILTSSEYDVIEAYDGEEALKKAKTENPDLILLDIMMPKLTGYEVCRELRTDRMTKDVPIVMITALHEMDDRIKGIEAGADDFISKPFNKAELLARVKSLLGMRQAAAKKDDAMILESILTSLAEGVIVTDAQWKIKHMNQEAQEFLNTYGVDVKNGDLLAYLSRMSLSIPMDTVLNSHDKTLNFQILPSNNQPPLYLNARLTKIFNEQENIIGITLVLRKER